MRVIYTASTQLETYIMQIREKMERER